MLQKHRTIKVDIKIWDIRAQLRNALRHHPYINVISDVIIEHLEPTDKGLVALFWAFSGIKDVAELRIGEEVYVDSTYVSTYMFDEQKMRDAGMYNKNTLPGKIIDVDIRKRKCYEVEYKGLKTDGTMDTNRTWVDPERITVT